MDILIINGGIPKGGRTEIITRFLAKEYQFEYIDIGEVNLPMLNGEASQWILPEIIAFKEKVGISSGIILISPEYHGGMTGALKNTLDFLTSDQLEYKPVALIATAGGGKGGINCLNNMRTVMRGFYANVIPKQIVLDPDCFNYDDGTIRKESRKLVNDMVKELKMYVNISTNMSPPVS